MNKHSLARILRTVLIIGTPLAALLQELAVLLSYDSESHYFAANAPLPVMANALTAAMFVLAVLCALVTPKPLNTTSPFGSQIWVAIPAAIGFGIGGIYLLIDFFGKQTVLSLAAAITLFLSAAYTLLSETKNKNTLLGFAPPIACALLIGLLYFDTSLEMNAPMKVAAQCALIPLMLYFTAELRYLLGRELPRLYSALALGSLAASSLCILTIPAASITGRLENAYCLISAIAVIGINATVALRQWRRLQTPELPSPEENETKETEAQ